MIKRATFWERPGWLFCVLLFLLHFASVKLTLFCAVTPEKVVVVWLPNAVLLAALVRFNGQRAPLMAALTFSSDILGNLGTFPLHEAVLLSIINLFEVMLSFLLMRRSGATFRLQRTQDLLRFVVAGPIAGTLAAALMAAVVMQHIGGNTTPYPTLVRLWWFGDALGLLIYTPMLLAFTYPPRQRRRRTWLDDAGLALTLILATAVLFAQGGTIDGFPVTPTLLLPAVAVIAFRFGIRMTTLFFALISLGMTMTMTMTSHFKPFGDVPVYLETLHAQEFILTLCIVGIGFAVMLNELRMRERELESLVQERTRELEQSNQLLAAMSATDGLTGIANRRRFDEMLDAEWSRAWRGSQPLAVAMLDVDLFKQYNDHYGHQAGDEVLRMVAQALAAQVRRSGDFVARYGGEEFAVISQATDAEHAHKMAALVCDAVEALRMPHVLSPYGVVTVSVGVAVTVPDADSAAADLLKQADASLYRAKQMGRNCAELAGISLGP